MKNIIFTLMIGLAIGLSDPAFGMVPEKEADPIVQCKKFKIPNYETSIECTYSTKRDVNFSKQGFATINFTILNNEQNKIGEILIQYYPDYIEYYKTSINPVVRLRHIEIKEEFQKKGHGTRAMETMIVALRKSEFFPKNTEMWLEYSGWHLYLEKFYKSFGFEETKEPAVFEVKVMKVELKKTKFPYSAKLKEKK